MDTLISVFVNQIKAKSSDEADRIGHEYLRGEGKFCGSANIWLFRSMNMWDKSTTVRVKKFGQNRHARLQTLA